MDSCQLLLLLKTFQDEQSSLFFFSKHKIINQIALIRWVLNPLGNHLLFIQIIVDLLLKMLNLK